MKTSQSQKVVFDLLAEMARRFVSTSTLALFAVFMWSHLQQFVQVQNGPLSANDVLMTGSMGISVLGLSALCVGCLMASLFSARQLAIALFGQNFGRWGYWSVQTALQVIMLAMIISLIGSGMAQMSGSLP